MLRQIALRSSSVPTRTILLTFHRRTLVTAAQKRNLNKSQIDGSGVEKNAPSGGATPPPPPPPSGGAPSTSPPPAGGGGSGSLLLGGGVLALGGLGYAYYNDMLPLGGEEEKTESVKGGETVAEEAPLVVAETVEEKATESKPDDAKVEEPSTGRVTVQSMTALGFPPKIERDLRPLPVPVHPDGNRVREISLVLPVIEAEAVLVTEEPTPAAVVAPQTAEEPTPAPVVTAVVVPQTAMDAATELSQSSNSASSHQMLTALRLLRSDLDESFLSDMDSLSPSDLKIRLVRLASEVSERARYEAVRTRELLQLKEKEVVDKYLDILQRQRLEFEELMARRLREREDELTRAHNKLLREKEDGVTSFVEATVEALKQEQEVELNSAMAEYKRNIGAELESKFKQNLVEEKKAFLKELGDKTSVVGQLAETVSKLEQFAKVSREFETGSQKAHRISAAGLGLSQRLETNKEAVMEVAALKAAAGEEGVIANSLSLLPATITKGVPTLPELQNSFESVHKAGRQAAMVPENQTDLSSQILGIIFSTLTVTPSADAVAASDETASPDSALSVASYHLQSGNLEGAVKALDGLKGQAAFTVRDWKRDAEHRIVVEKVLKVIKMECALLNQSMSG